jgi:hypothetical protein
MDINSQAIRKEPEIVTLFYDDHESADKRQDTSSERAAYRVSSPRDSVKATDEQSPVYNQHMKGGKEKEDEV